MSDKRKRSQVVADGDEDVVDVSEVKKAKRSKTEKPKKEKKEKKEKKGKKEKKKDKSKGDGDDSKAEKKKRKKEKKKTDVEPDANPEKATEMNGSKEGEDAEGEEDRKSRKKLKKEAKQERDRAEKKERKQRKKNEISGKKEMGSIVDGEDEDQNAEHPAADTINGAGEDNAQQSQQKQTRFICFIGNLPFTTTYESVEKHFSKIEPSKIRLPMAREGGKNKGFAFLEFASYDRMKTCLKLYHHSHLDDGKSPSRKINVELTAGGGGSKSEARKTRIVERNKKLGEERERAAKAKDKRKVVEKKKEGTQQGGEDEVDHGDIHPSRRARFN